MLAACTPCKQNTLCLGALLLAIIGDGTVSSSCLGRCRLHSRNLLLCPDVVGLLELIDLLALLHHLELELLDDFCDLRGSKKRESAQARARAKQTYRTQAITCHEAEERPEKEAHVRTDLNRTDGRLGQDEVSTYSGFTGLEGRQDLLDCALHQDTADHAEAFPLGVQVFERVDDDPVVERGMAQLSEAALWGATHGD